MLLVVVLLFILLSPGVLLTLPPGSKGVWMSRQTSFAAVVVHTLVFLAALYAVKNYVYPSRIDAFQDKKGYKKEPFADAKDDKKAGSAGGTGAKGA
jgi:hypothetical protein